MSAQECPPASALLDLLNEACSVQDRDRWEDHVGCCEACQQVLQNLAVEGTKWDKWEEQLRNDPSSWREKTLIAPVEFDPSTWPVVPGYETLGVLGQGGMGVVFKAKNLALSRLVALKTLPTSGTGREELKRRLLKEAETLAQLHHPNIVQIFEVLETDDSIVLVLELVHGGSLMERLRDLTMPPKEAAELLERLARTIQVAHDAGIIHRDLKPSNVLLTVEGDAKLADFGIARQQDIEGETKTGHVMGTPSYLAPEQAQARPGWVTPAVDTYGLGAILYECLAGRPPFRGANNFETLRQVIQEEPPSPSRLQPRIPRDLVTICLKCLQKEPANRYGSCRELADDLQRFTSGQPIHAKRTSFSSRVFKWSRRHPWIAALTASTTILLVALLGVWFNFTRELTRVNTDLRFETQRANREEKAARASQKDAELQRSIAESTLLQISSVLRANAKITRSETGDEKEIQFGLPALAYLNILSRLQTEQLMFERASGYHWLGRQFLDLGDSEQAVLLLTRAVEVRRIMKTQTELAPPELFNYGRSLADLGSALEASDDLIQSESILQEAVQILSDPQLLNSEIFRAASIPYQANCLLILAKIDARQDRKDKAKQNLIEARQLLLNIPEEERIPMTEAVLERVESRLKLLTNEP